MRNIVVALTGGIGTGKTTALEAFRRAGAGTVSCDAIAHELSRRGGAVQRSVARSLGRRWLDARGGLDRRRLAAAVFADPRLRRRLERASHPAILRRLKALVAASRRRVVVADVPLLFEAGRALRRGRDYDLSMLVTARPRAALRRAMRRDGASRAEVLARARAQLPLGRKEGLADVVVRNDGSLRGLERRVREYHKALELTASR